MFPGYRKDCPFRQPVSWGGSRRDSPESALPCYRLGVTQRDIVIDEFRDLPGLSEIIGLGAVRQPFGEAQEVEISTLLAMTDDRGDRGVPSTTAVKWIGCGQMDLLAAGSRWKNGSPTLAAPSTSVSGMFEVVFRERVGQGIDPPRKNRPFPSRAIAGAGGFLLRRIADPANIHAAGGSKKGPEKFLLPFMELVRALFAVSERVLLQLFDGIRSSTVMNGRGLIDHTRSYLSKDSTVYLAARQALSRDEALIIAAMIADPTLFRMHNSVFQQLSVNEDWRGGLPVYVELEWPWQVPIAIELEGRWVDREGPSSRFLCTRLVSLGIPMPFRRVVVRHPGSEPGDTDVLPPPSDRVRATNARLFVLTTGRAASPSRRAARFGSDVVNLPTADGIEVEWVACGGVARKDRGQIGENPRDEAPVGTGGRKPGADANVGAAEIRRRRLAPGEVVEGQERSHLEALKATWDALSAACVQEGWSLGAAPTASSPSIGANFGGLNLPWEPLVAVVRSGSNRLLVVDRGSASGDECSLGLLVPVDPNQHDRQLATAARKLCTSVNGRWRSRNLKTPDFSVKGTARPTEVWVDQERYVNLLIRRIASALGL